MTSTARTHQCGELAQTHRIDRHARRGGSPPPRATTRTLAFVDVRDHTGVTQCVVDNTVDVRPEYVVRVTGVVAARPDEERQPRLPTGEVEIQDCEVEVLSVAEPPPFPISERADTVAENTRLQYRYLDIAASACSATCSCGGQLGDPHGDGGAGLRRGRDADARAVDAGRAASSSSPAASSRVRSTHCRRARSCSSSC